MLIQIILTLFLLVPSAHSAKDGRWYAGTGVLSHNLFKWTQDPSGEASFFGTNYILPLQLRAQYALTSDLFFTPRFLYTPIGREAPDSGSNSKIMVLSLPVTKNINDSWDWSAGLALFIYSVSGDGGSKSIEDGGGTSTFYFPNKTASAKNIILETGISHTHNDLNFGLDLFLISPLSKRRSFSLFLSVNYGFGE